MPDNPMKLKVGVPGSCIHCGFTPEKMQEEYGIGFMMFEVPNTTCIFFQCPHCGGLMGNVHAVENTKKIIQERIDEKRKEILIPHKKGLLYLPGRGEN